MKTFGSKVLPRPLKGARLLVHILGTAMVIVSAGCGVTPNHSAAEKTPRNVPVAASPNWLPSSQSSSTKANRVNIRLSGPCIGAAPHYLAYSVDLPRAMLVDADFLWMDNGVWIGKEPRGVKILEEPGIHRISVLVVTKKGEQYRGIATVQVLDSAQAAGKRHIRSADIPPVRTVTPTDAGPRKAEPPRASPADSRSNDCDLAALSRPTEADRRSIAIIDFEVTSLLSAESQEAGRALGDLCRSLVQRTSAFKVIDRENMKSILGEQDFAAVMRCENSKCLINYGRLLSAQKMLHGRISKLDASTFVVYVGITDVNSGEVTASSTGYVKDIQEAARAIGSITCVAIRDSLSK